MITLKDNQPKLIEEAREVFSEAESNAFSGVASYRESSRGHGRIEERVYYAIPVPEDGPAREKCPVFKQEQLECEKTFTV